MHTLHSKPITIDCFETDDLEPTHSIDYSQIISELEDLRMKYVDIECELETDMEKAIRSKLSNGTGNLVILVNFTALPATRAILKKLEGEN